MIDNLVLLEIFLWISYQNEHPSFNIQMLIIPYQKWHLQFALAPRISVQMSAISMF